MTGTRMEGRLLPDYAQLIHARHKPCSRPCAPNWIRTSDAQASSKGGWDSDERELHGKTTEWMCNRKAKTENG